MIQKIREVFNNAKKGNINAQWKVISRCLKQKNYKKAVSLLKLVAAQGDPYAEYNLGYSYQHGEGVRKNFNKAINWYKKAAKKGFDSAQLNLGILLANREKPNFKEALRLYRLAASQGNKNALYNLGLYYERGRGVPQNLSQSLKWYTKAARRGVADAKRKIAHLKNIRRKKDI